MGFELAMNLSLDNTHQQKLGGGGGESTFWSPNIYHNLLPPSMKALCV